MKNEGAGVDAWFKLYPDGAPEGAANYSKIGVVGWPAHVAKFKLTIST